jgi:predicted AAA+ superfamily ATPase
LVFGSYPAIFSHINRTDDYIDLLEKSFAIFKLGGYSRNIRKEVTRHNKIYFYDLGIRNAMIDNFLPSADSKHTYKLNQFSDPPKRF